MSGSWVERELRRSFAYQPRMSEGKRSKEQIDLQRTHVMDRPAACSNDRFSGTSSNCRQSAPTRSANAPCDAPKTRSPTWNGQPFGIGDDLATTPANSTPGTQGNGGCV